MRTDANFVVLQILQYTGTQLSRQLMSATLPTN